jgi:hypothetical protein
MHGVFFKGNKMKATLLTLLLFVLNGCASVAKESHWVPTFGTTENFDKSIAECEYDLQLMGKSMDRYSAAVFGMQSPIFEKCMNKHGYKWQKKDTQ